MYNVSLQIRKLPFKTLLVKNKNESAWHRAYRKKASKNKKRDALNKSKFYA